MILRKMLIFALLMFLLVNSAEGKLCLSSVVAVSLDNETRNVSWTNDTTPADLEFTELSDIPRRKVIPCPTSKDPVTHTECCPMTDESPATNEQLCCPAHRRFYEIDNTLATIIAASVITTCLILSVLAVVCCFYSKCPLYDTCRVQYEQSDVLTLGKEEDTMGLNNMPAEPDHKTKHIYAPNNHITVRQEQLQLGCP